MDSGARRQHRRLLKLSCFVVACFFAGLVAAGAMAGEGPLSALSSLSSSDSTASDTTSTDTATTDATSSSTDTSSTDTTSTDTSASDISPTDTTPTETTTDTTPAPPAGPPTIASDQADYNPGAIVTLTGANWAPGELVHVFVNDDLGKTWSYSADVTAGVDGSFTNQFQLPTSFVATYSVTATGTVSGTATTSFTDGNVNVRVTGGPTSVSVTWRRHTGTNCTGALTGSPNSGTINATDSGNGGSIPSGAGATESLELTAGTAAGFAFSSWSNGSFLPSDPSTANPVCLVGSGSTQNTRLNYMLAGNHAPNVAANNASVSAPEGSNAMNSGTWSDADAGDTVTLSASVGTVTKSGTNVSGTWSWSLATTDGPAGPTTVTITANDGHTTATTTFTYAVTNVAPSVTAPSNQTANVAVSKSFNLGSFNDPGADNPWAVDVDWGDSSTHTAFNASSVGSLGSSSHTYSTAGAKTVTVKVTDKDGASDSKTFSVTVSKQDQTITFSALGAKTYGDADFSVSATASSGLPVSFAASGNCTVSGSTVHITAAGGCTVTASQGGNSAYNPAPDVPRGFTIDKKTASLSADAGQHKTYGDPDPQLTTSHSGFLGADLGAGKITFSATRAAGESVAGGPYLVTPHADDNGSGLLGNYDVAFNTATFTIDKAPLAATADDKSKVYGDPNPQLTGGFDTSKGPRNADVITLSFTTSAGQASGVGTYPIVPHVNATNAVLANYQTPTLTNGALTVTKAPLAASADSKTKIVNAPSPTLTGSFDTGKGPRNGDAITLSFTTSATQTSPVGSYPITPVVNATSAVLANYQAPVLNNGTLTVTYAPAGSSCLGSAGHTILQPINADGTSVFKQGSTVPAKFRVCDANGASIGTAGVVTSFKLYQTISGTETSSPNEDVVSTTPDTAFRWSSTDQQWIFNINTKPLGANKTYVYRITLNDTTMIQFQFGLR